MQFVDRRLFRDENGCSCDRICSVTTERSCIRSVTAALGPNNGASFDRVIGAREQQGRYCEAECLRGPEIEDKLEFLR
jgi:hypothetical protein